MSSELPLERNDQAKPLIEQIAELGARPFVGETVQSPWSTLIDAPSHHAKVKANIVKMLTECHLPESTRCLTLIAQSGYGKSHLLKWARQHLDDRNMGIFIYVPPYLPGIPGGSTLEQHVLRAVLESLLYRSDRQQYAFKTSFHKFLVACYDHIINSSWDTKRILRVGSWWDRLFRRSTLRIGSSGTQSQLASIQPAFGRRAFLARAFDEFREQHPVGADGVQPDWDAFVAGSLLACGNSKQRWGATGWFRAEALPSDVLSMFHLDHLCHGTEKIRNCLFTLQQMMGQPFCFAFDQLEDTYVTLSNGTNEEATRFTGSLGLFLRNLSVMPNVCLLFACQVSVWQDFVRRISPMLIDRMTQDYGPQLLLPLDDSAARELVLERMRAFVWRRLGEQGCQDDPLYPFTSEEIRQIRVDSGGELRPFLQRMQAIYNQRVHPPVKRKTITIISFEPREIISNEPTRILIKGDNLPEDVRILIAGQQVTPTGYRPDRGEIDITTPVGLVGSVDLRIESVDDSTNSAGITLLFQERDVPRPYNQHLDPLRFRRRREYLDLTQTDVANKVGLKQSKISDFERLKWTKAPDDLYARLAELYGQPLSSFLKNQTPQ